MLYSLQALYLNSAQQYASGSPYDAASIYLVKYLVVEIDKEEYMVSQKCAKANNIMISIYNVITAIKKGIWAISYVISNFKIVILQQLYQPVSWPASQL